MGLRTSALPKSEALESLQIRNLSGQFRGDFFWLPKNQGALNKWRPRLIPKKGLFLRTDEP